MFSGGSDRGQAVPQWGSKILTRSHLTPLGLVNQNTKFVTELEYSELKTFTETVDTSICSALVSECQCEKCNDASGFFWG